MEEIKEKPKKIVKPFVDWALDKLISRKFIAACTATWLVYEGKINGTEWTLFMGLWVVGIIFLQYLERMAEKRKQVNDFRGSKDINIFEEDN